MPPPHPGPGPVRPPRAREAILLTDTVGGRQLVVACCPLASKARVRAGLTVAEAQARLVGASVRCEPHDAERDRKALRSLAVWARRFSPVVSEDPPGGLLLDIAGCERVFGGEAPLLKRFTGSLRAFGFHARAAVADTVGCAWAVARFGAQDDTHVASGQERMALSPLPVAALRLEDAVCQNLFEVNIERVEHLFALARNQLFGRFGADLLLRLDQATGYAFEPVRPLAVSELPFVERVFQGPVKDLELLFDVVQAMTEEIVQKLDVEQVGARRVDLVLERSDAPALRRTLALTRPSVDAKHLFALLRPKVEVANLGFGVERLVLTASRVSTLQHRQKPVFADAVSEGGLDRETGELLDVLVERCGHDRVLRAERVESHVPEQAIRAYSVLEPAAKPRKRIRQRTKDRPSVLFERPEPIEMIVVKSDGSPAWMRWRSTECRILSVQGPERIGAPWWQSGRKRAAGTEGGILDRCLAHRDYYKVQDDRGRWLWLFHGLDSRRWFVHGEWA